MARYLGGNKSHNHTPKQETGLCLVLLPNFGNTGKTLFLIFFFYWKSIFLTVYWLWLPLPQCLPVVHHVLSHPDPHLSCLTLENKQVSRNTQKIQYEKTKTNQIRTKQPNKKKQKKSTHIQRQAHLHTQEFHKNYKTGKSKYISKGPVRVKNKTTTKNPT